MAKLGDIAKIQSGGTPARSISEYWENGTIPWVKISDIKEKRLCNTEEYITKKGLDESSAKLFPKGTILFSIFATLGAATILDIDAATNQAIAGIQITDMSVLPEYVYYCLLSKKKYVNEIGRGVAQNNINLSLLREIDISIPSLEEQKRIVYNLSKVEELINLRRFQLSKLDELVKSQFIEQFGADSKYPIELLDRNVEEMFIGPFGSSLKNECFVSKEEGFCMVYEQKHAIQKTMDLETRYVTEQKYKELQRFNVTGGDIIVSCRGTIGEVFSIPDDAPLGIMHPSIMKIRLKKEKYDKDFFVFALEQYMKEHMNEANGTAVKMAVSAKTLGKERFVIPDLQTQQAFVAFEKQRDKSKFAIKESLVHLRLLYDNMSQMYFSD